MDDLLPDLLLIVLVWLLFNYWPMWEISRQEGGPSKKKRTRQRSKGPPEPKPFPGLTRKPDCPVCENEAQARASIPEPPPLMQSERGAPSSVDTRRQFCPQDKCRYFGWRERGNIIANGHPGGGLWRQYYCKACGCYFLETHGTVFFGKRQAVPVLLFVLAALVEGMGIRAAGRVFGLDPDTIQAWLVSAAGQLSALATHFLRQLEPEQVQLDELFAFTAPLKDSEAELLAWPEDSPLWLWTAMDPVSKLLLVALVGHRSLAVAQTVVHLVKQRLAPGCLPLFTTDGLAHYQTALLTHFGHWLQPPPTPSGRTPQPRWFPLPGLLYAQLIKQRRRRRLVRLKQRLVFGDWPQVQAVLDRLGWKLNTAFVERLNLTIRQHIPALGRRVIQRAHSPTGLSHQVDLFLLYYNFCLPHTSLRLPLATPQPTRGKGSLKQGYDCTPAMAAGLTDHVWSLREILLYRVPPWPQNVLGM
jgi:IS1 family transposase/transposase-like protein